MYMETTIRISNSVKSRLDKIKLFGKESYNDVIEVLLEDDLEINEKTRREIAEARKRVGKGEFYSQEEVEAKLGL